MSKSWNINDTIEMYLSKNRKEAINHLSKLRIKDVAQALYDFKKEKIRPRESIYKDQDKYCNNKEFEKVCDKDQNTIEDQMKRVRQDGQQPMNNSNNQSNNSNNQTNNQQNQINYWKNITILLVEQNTQYKNKIHFLEDQINQFKIDNDKLIKLNNLLIEKILEKNNIEIQLLQQVQEKTNELEIILLKTQLKSVNENSIKIPEDNQQFKERIDNINIERDQIIKKMEDILKQFEQLQSRNTIKQNSDNQQIDQDEYQNIVNQIKGAIKVIISMQTSLQDFEKQLESKLENQNNQSKEIIRDLIKKLQGNRQCFIYVQKILESIFKILNEFKEINDMQVKRNQELSKQLEEFQKQNNKVKEDFQVQINQLKEYNQQEQQHITNEETIQNIMQRVNINEQQQINNSNNQQNNSNNQQNNSNDQTNHQQNQIDQDEYQNILSQIENATEVIKQMQTSLQDFEKQLQSKLENQNTQSKEIIRDLLEKSKGNIQNFIYFKFLLESIFKILNKFKEINDVQVKKNQELSKQLEEFQKQNNKIKEDFQVQINQLKKYNQQEQQHITNEETIQNNQFCLDISNKYSKLFNEFNDQIMQEIHNLSKMIILIWFPNEKINLKIRPSSQQLQDIQSFINNLRNENQINDNDGLEQQQQISMELFKKIYPAISNEYIYEIFESIQEIKIKKLEYNKKINNLKQEIENQASHN